MQVMKNIIIANLKEFERKKQEFKKQGKKGFHVVSDFDSTLTKGFVDGERVHSTFEIVRKEGYLAKEYVKKSYALYDIYHPIEINPDISPEEKDKKMLEWWKKHLQLMIDYGMNDDIIKEMVKSCKINLRGGFYEFISLLKDNKVPLLILSAGMGNVIKEFMESKSLLYSNTHIISNFYEFDKNKKVTGFKSKIVHAFNKSEVQVKDTPYHEQIVQRKNVILLGDSPGDLHMAEGMDHDNIIKIGFLNEEIDNLLDFYKESFDVVIVDDGPMDFINELLREIISS